jgi:aminopeptidase N
MRKIPLSLIALAVSQLGVQYAHASDVAAATNTDIVDPLLAATPSHYDLLIEPDLANFSFGGQAVIDLDVPSETSQISLNAKALSFEKAELVPITGDEVPVALQVGLDAAKELVHLRSATPIKAGQYKLSIAYRGTINTEAMAGLFAIDARGSVYDENNPKIAGANQLQLFTHAQPNDARSIFPTWDTPGYKMTFDVSIVHPAGFLAVGNMPATGTKNLPTGKTVTSFATTPSLSSYLLFFGIGDFQRKSIIANGTDYGLVLRRSEQGNYDYTLDQMPKITAKLADYFKQPYGLPKMDFVLSAKKLKSFQAMENWGAILGSENDAKFDYYIGGGDNKANSSYVLSHEITHQWLGNIVTPKSWADLWLSEGMAVQMTTKMVDQEFPALRIEQQTIGNHDRVKSMEAAIKTLAVSSPVAVEYAQDPRVGSIVYEKGGAILSMVEQAMGAEKWQMIMQSYVSAHKFQSVSKEALFGAIIAFGEPDASASLRDFATKPGFPLVTVENAKCDNGNWTLGLSQRPYPGETAAGDISSIWTIPVRGRSADGSEHLHYLTAPTGEMRLPNCQPFTLNAGASGYYRVDYSRVQQDRSWSDLGSLAEADQYGVLLDAFANANEAGAKLVNAMELLQSSKIEQSPELLSLAIEKYDAILASYAKPADLPTRKLVFAQIRETLGPILEKIGYEDSLNRDDPMHWVRSSLIDLLDKANYPPLLAHPNAVFRQEGDSFRRLFNPNSATWARVAFRNLSLLEWTKATSNLTADTIYGVSDIMGASKNIAIVNRALNFANAGNWEPYTRSQIITSAGAEHPDHVLAFLLSTAGLKEKLPDVYFETAMSVGEKCGSAASADKLQKHFSAQLSPENQKRLDDVVKGIRLRHAQQQQIRAELTPWVQQKKPRL